MRQMQTVSGCNGTAGCVDLRAASLSQHEFSEAMLAQQRLLPAWLPLCGRTTHPLRLAY